MIDRSQIDDVLARVDIIDVISARIQLKKYGKNYKACCPFHDEKTPSFSINHDKQYYHCFGCGVSGDAIKFIQEYDNLDFRIALNEVAAMAGVALEETNTKPIMPRKLREQIDLDRYFLAVYESDLSKGIRINYKDARQAKIARARIEGVKDKYQL